MSCKLVNVAVSNVAVSTFTFCRDMAFMPSQPGCSPRKFQSFNGRRLAALSRPLVFPGHRMRPKTSAATAAGLLRTCWALGCSLLGCCLPLGCYLPLGCCLPSGSLLLTAGCSSPACLAGHRRLPAQSQPKSCQQDFLNPRLNPSGILENAAEAALLLLLAIARPVGWHSPAPQAVGSAHCLQPCFIAQAKKCGHANNFCLLDFNICKSMPAACCPWLSAPRLGTCSLVLAPRQQAANWNVSCNQGYQFRQVLGF